MAPPVKTTIFNHRVLLTFVILCGLIYQSQGQGEEPDNEIAAGAVPEAAGIDDVEKRAVHIKQAGRSMPKRKQKRSAHTTHAPAPAVEDSESDEILDDSVSTGDSASDENLCVICTEATTTHKSAQTGRRPPRPKGSKGSKGRPRPPH